MKIRGSIGLALVLTGSACGFGANVHTQSASVDTGDQDTIAMTSQSVSVYDATGILLSAAGGAGSAYNAKNKAEKEAIKSGAKVGDSYSYSYNVAPPAPGIWTSFSYAWGDSTTDDDRDISFSRFDMRSQVGNWRLFGMKADLHVGVVWTTYENLVTKDTGSIDKAETVNMPLGLKLARGLGDKATLSGFLAIDPIVSGLLLALGEPWQFVTASTRVDYRIIDNLNAYGEALATRAVPIGGNYTMNEFVGTAGLTLIFGESYMNFAK